MTSLLVSLRRTMSKMTTKRLLPCLVFTTLFSVASSANQTAESDLHDQANNDQLVKSVRDIEANTLPKAKSTTEIKVNPGKYFSYYHLQYLLDTEQYKINLDYGFNAGGQFEVLVPKEHFPIAAPNCNRDIIIRMPWSSIVDDKKALYDQLLSKQQNTLVTLELNPYVKVISEQPLQLELTYCNVFFRHKSGNYYDQL